MEKFLFKKLGELEFEKESQNKLSNRFAALENVSDNEDIDSAWENIKADITNLAKESRGLCDRKQHKPWFDEECSHYTDQRKQAKVQKLLDQKGNNVDNLNNVMHDAIRYFRGKSRDYMKDKLMKWTQTVRIRISEVCIGALVTIRRVSSLELI